ncbi:unnamed protein product, partial [Symbiodinium sp. CCMP2456]
MAYVEEAANAIHQEEAETGLWHPVCSPLMDSYLSEYFVLEASYPNAMDVWCLNLYRGTTFGSLFSTYPSNLPMLITEYGADAWDGYNQREWANSEQTDALVALATELRDWREVVAGGLIFSFQDEWWKCGAVSTHDTCGGAFANLVDGIGNEEWWGLYGTSAGANPQARSPRGAVSALTDLWAADSFVGATYGSADADLYV